MSITILVVDDEPTISDALKMMLEDEGYRVVCAGNGQEALDLIARDPPDLIISDVMMPLIDGITLIRQLRERGDATPVVLMSAIHVDVDLPDVSFIPKPFELDQMI